MERCELCSLSEANALWHDARCLVVRVGSKEAEDYPGFCRVVWRQHVREMTDLSTPDRQHLMSLVFAVETALRSLYQPTKINLASLGNMVPHLHWHVIPRFSDDPQFPAPIWSNQERPSGQRPVRAVIDDQSLHAMIDRALGIPPA